APLPIFLIAGKRIGKSRLIVKLRAWPFRRCQRRSRLHREALTSGDRLFSICYFTTRSLVKQYGEKLSIKISPHDLRRHSATYASRNGVPLEIISKVILRHQDLKTTQMYLGKVSDTEAIRWMDTLHER